MTRPEPQAAHEEAPSRFLVVWHLRRRPDQEVWCLVTKEDDLFALTVSRDPEDPTRPMAGHYTDKASIIRRADLVKQEFLGRGWHEAGLDEHGSGADDRVTLARPPRWVPLCPRGPE